MISLETICSYRNEKASAASITTEDLYVSTESMGPNRGGVSRAASVPSEGKVSCFRKGDTLVSNIRPYFKKIWKADLDGYCSNDVLVFQPGQRCSADYLCWLLCDDAFFDYVMATSKGTKMPRGDKSAIMSYAIPSNSEMAQRNITSILNPIQAKIEMNAKLNGYLEELCDALFLDYLERADSSWHEGTLEELAEVKYGKDHKKLADGPYPVYGSGGFMRSAEKSLFSGESVLIPRKGSLNNVMYVNGAFWTVDTMFFTVPRIAGAAKFLYQYVKRLDLASMNSGSAVPSMTISILNALSLPVPPRDSLLSFNAKLQSMYDAVRANNLENRRLESLRDSLLPKLMAGEIDVSKIDLTQLNSHLAANLSNWHWHRVVNRHIRQVETEAWLCAPWLFCH